MAGTSGGLVPLPRFEAPLVGEPRNEVCVDGYEQRGPRHLSDSELPAHKSFRQSMDSGRECCARAEMTSVTHWGLPNVRTRFTASATTASRNLILTGMY